MNGDFKKHVYPAFLGVILFSPFTIVLKMEIKRLEMVYIALVLHA